LEFLDPKFDNEDLIYKVHQLTFKCIHDLKGCKDVSTYKELMVGCSPEEEESGEIEFTKIVNNKVTRYSQKVHLPLCNHQKVKCERCNNVISNAEKRQHWRFCRNEVPEALSQHQSNRKRDEKEMIKFKRQLLGMKKP
jgi:hypothetical protein